MQEPNNNSSIKTLFTIKRHWCCFWKVNEKDVIAYNARDLNDCLEKQLYLRQEQKRLENIINSAEKLMVFVSAGTAGIITILKSIQYGESVPIDDHLRNKIQRALNIVSLVTPLIASGISFIIKMSINDVRQDKGYIETKLEDINNDILSLRMTP